MWEYVMLFVVSAVAVGLLIRAGYGIYQTIKKRNRKATPAEQEAYRQKQRDMEPTPQELARRRREGLILAECRRVQNERDIMIRSGSTQPLPEWPRDASGDPLC